MPDIMGSYYKQFLSIFLHWPHIIKSILVVTIEHFDYTPVYLQKFNCDNDIMVLLLIYCRTTPGFLWLEHTVS